VAREADLTTLRPDGTRRRILTGDRTTGKLHLGHWVGSLRDRVRLQHTYDTFILMADVQALTTHYDRPEVLKESVREVALDYLAAGIDPEVATIVIQSLVPQIAELTVYYGLLVPVRSLIDNPTTKAEAEAHGFELETRSATNAVPNELSATVLPALVASYSEVNDASIDQVAEALDKLLHHTPAAELVQAGIILDSDAGSPLAAATSPEGLKFIRDEVIKTRRAKGFTSVTYGFLGYPISQAADITFVDADLVPVGPDQVPLIELCREVADRFNHQYGGSGAGVPARDGQAGTEARPTEILRKPQALLGTTDLIRGIDGSAKMSKSQGNAVYLSESDAEIWDKLRPAPTDPQRVRKTDPGRPELCNIFAYHTVFNGGREAAIDEAAIGAASVEEVAHNCRNAAWGCIDCKKNLAIKLTALLDPMRERRAKWAAQQHKVREILMTGTERARQEGEKTLQRIRSAMHMDYFE
jgi:tryptophanyl-tRNA synthetase